MKKREPKVLIDTTAEIKAVADYLTPRWDGVNGDLVPVVTRIFDVAARLARGWFDEHAVYFSLSDKAKLRESILEQALTGRAREVGPDYDLVQRQLTRMMFGLKPMRETALTLETGDGWRYEREAKKVAADIHREFPWTTGIKPNGWEVMRPVYAEFQGMEEWDSKASREAFMGHDLSGAGAPDLVSATALPYVMYDDVCQGRRPAYTFVSALFSHGLSLAEHNNTVSMVQEIESLALSGFPAEVLFGNAISWSHPILRGLDGAERAIERRIRGIHYGPSDYQRALQRVPRPASLEDRKAAADRIIAEILAKEASGESERQKAEERKLYQHFLRAELQSPVRVVEAEGPGM